MTSVFSPIKKMGGQEFRRVTEVTYLTIVHVGLALAYRSFPLQAAYCAA
jgi:hypothetical protein